MKNENHFGTLTERMLAFREEVLDEKPYVDAERAIWATEAQGHGACPDAAEDSGAYDRLY